MSGKTFEDFIHDEVLVKAGMQLAALGSTEKVAQFKAAVGAKDDFPTGQKWHTRKLGWAMKAASGILTSATELSKWHAALNLDTLLSANSQQIFWSSTQNGYGFGNFFSTLPDGSVIAMHSGQNRWGNFWLLGMASDGSGGFAFLTGAGKGESVFGRIGGYALLGEELPLKPKSKAAQAPMGVFRTKGGGEVRVSANKALLSLIITGDPKLAQSLVAPDNSPLSIRCGDLSDQTVRLLSTSEEARKEQLTNLALFPKIAANIDAAIRGARVMGAATRKEPDSSTFITTVELSNGGSNLAYYCLLWEPRGGAGDFAVAGAGTAQRIFKGERTEKLGLAMVKLFPTESGRWYSMSPDTGLPQVRIEFAPIGSAVGVSLTGAGFKAEAQR